MKNLELRKQLEEHEAKYKGKDLISTFIPKPKALKTCQKLDVILSEKKKLKFEEKVNKILSEVFKTNSNDTQEQSKIVKDNYLRRSKLKINQNTHSEKYYSDCFINSEEYKNKK
jgi:uncharacterized membrane protein